jgi:hypothetical protein
MQTMNMAFPVVPGQEDALRELAAQLNGPKKEAFNDFLTRVGASEERWYLQDIGGQAYCLMFLAAKDLGSAFAALAVSKHPFDVWMKERNREIFNIDFEAPSEGPMPETLLDHVTLAKELVA